MGILKDLIDVATTMSSDVDFDMDDNGFLTLLFKLY